MKIILDGMGGDNAPEEIVKGAVQASKKIEHEIHIVGDEEKITSILSELEYDEEKIQIIHASEVIENEDSPVKAIRKKKDSSMVRGLEAVRDGAGDLFISAGNSGALMIGGVLVLGRIKGIERPAIGSAYPMLEEEGRAALMLDSGANAECKPQNFLEFALMGSIYTEKVMGIDNPKIGLVNMGVEPKKGSKTLKEAYKIMTEAKEEGRLPGFLGNVEARDIPVGICDVIVCDGLVGNVLLKTTEGVALTISHLIRRKFTDGIVAKAGAALLYGKLGELKKAFDYNEYGGAPILGVKGAMVKMHGSANADAVCKSIIKALPFMEKHIVEDIEKSMQEL